MAFNTWNKVRELADFQLPKVCCVHILCQVSGDLDEHETRCASTRPKTLRANWKCSNSVPWGRLSPDLSKLALYSLISPVTKTCSVPVQIGTMVDNRVKARRADRQT